MLLIKSTFENAIEDCISLFACPKNGLFIACESETAHFIGRFPGAILSIFEFLRNVSHEGFRGALMVLTYTYISETPYTERIHLPTCHTVPISLPSIEMCQIRFDVFRKGFLSFIIHTCYVHATEQSDINMYSRKSLW